MKSDRQLPCAEVQQVCLGILEYLKEFCQENGLRFWLCGGALIGAVREGGFLEWDDDADVFMPRPDYERLKEIWSERADTSRFVCEYNDGVTENRHPFLLIRDRRTTLVRENQADLDLIHGVAVDVLPIDGCPSGFKRKIQKMRALLFMLYNTGVVPKNHGKAVTLGGRLLLSLVPRKKHYALSKKIEKKMIATEFGSTEYVTELCAGPRYLSNEYRYSDFSSSVTIPFENTSMPAMCGYDGYLSLAFGDYMTPPEKTERVQSHDAAFFDLSMSADDYLLLRKEAAEGASVSGEQLKRLQKKSLELFGFFSDFCREKKLRYFLCGGSLIGAVREGGFLPWDDDIDVFMPRPDYERLCAMQDSGEIPDGYCVSRSCRNEYVRVQIGGFFDLSTTFIKTRQYDLDIPHAVRIDIIPLDGCPTGRVKRLLQMFSALMRSLYVVGEPHTSKGKLFELAGRLLLWLHPSPRSRMKAAARWEKRMTRYPYDESSKLTELVTWFKYMKLEYPKEWFAEGNEVIYEGMSVPAPSDCDSYLKAVFGDYMTPPPVEERVASHDAVFCDTERRYTDYKGLYYCITPDKINHQLKRGKEK